MIDRFLDWAADGLGFAHQRWSWKKRTFRELNTTERYWFFLCLIGAGLVMTILGTILLGIFIAIAIAAPIIPIVLALIVTVPGALVYFTRDKK